MVSLVDTNGQRDSNSEQLTDVNSSDANSTLCSIIDMADVNLDDFFRWSDEDRRVVERQLLVDCWLSVPFKLTISHVSI